jgi:hypothetical protein
MAVPRQNGRPPKLTDNQLKDIERRINNGEKAIDLAKEYKVSKAFISGKFSKSKKQIESIATKVYETEKAMSELTVFEQNLIVHKVNELHLMETHLRQGSRHAASIYHRLMLGGKNKMDKFDINGGDIDEDILSDMMRLGMTANTFAKVPIDLKRSEKDVVKEQEKHTIEVIHSPSIANV